MTKAERKDKPRTFKVWVAAHPDRAMAMTRSQNISGWGMYSAKKEFEGQVRATLTLTLTPTRKAKP